MRFPFPDQRRHEVKHFTLRLPGINRWPERRVKQTNHAGAAAPQRDTESSREAEGDFNRRIQPSIFVRLRCPRERLRAAFADNICDGDSGLAGECAVPDEVLHVDNGRGSGERFRAAVVFGRKRDGGHEFWGNRSLKLALQLFSKLATRGRDRRPNLSASKPVITPAPVLQIVNSKNEAVSPD